MMPRRSGVPPLNPPQSRVNVTSLQRQRESGETPALRQKQTGETPVLRMAEELNEELETLNGEAHGLEERIAANVAAVLEGH